MGYTDGNSITSSKEHMAREGDAKGSASADDPRGGRFRSRRDADRGGEQQSAGAGETLALQDVVTWGKARPRARGLLPAQLPEGFRFMRDQSICWDPPRPHPGSCPPSPTGRLGPAQGSGAPAEPPLTLGSW